jgi:hypothetical protein
MSLQDDMIQSHLDALEESSNVKVTDRAQFCNALQGLICCLGGESEEEPSDEEDKPKKGISIAMILGGKPKKAG